MSNRIQILQWREFGDDEDCLTVAPFASDDDRDLQHIEAENNDLVISDDDDDDPDGHGRFMTTNDITIEDGEIIENEGRKFRINITEVTSSELTTCSECHEPFKTFVDYSRHAGICAACGSQVDLTDSDCDCNERSWYGAEHDTACPLSGIPIGASIDGCGLCSKHHIRCYSGGEGSVICPDCKREGETRL